jgi:hypothetical protein
VKRYSLSTWIDKKLNLWLIEVNGMKFCYLIAEMCQFSGTAEILSSK